MEIRRSLCFVSVNVQPKLALLRPNPKESRSVRSHPLASESIAPVVDALSADPVGHSEIQKGHRATASQSVENFSQQVHCPPSCDEASHPCVSLFASQPY